MIRGALLFLPATRKETPAKAASYGATGVIIDLEDAVAPDEKDLARSRAVTLLTESDVEVPLLVRCNSLDTSLGESDLAALANTPGCAGIVLPKCDGSEQVAAALDLLSSHSDGKSTVPLIPLIETAKGLADVMETAKAPGVVGLMFGAYDFGSDMGVYGVDLEDDVMIAARTRIALAAKAERLFAIDTPSNQYQDPTSVRQSAARGQRMGFSAKACIHPLQVAPTLSAYLPRAEQVQAARRIVEAFSASNRGAVSVEGRMVDKPIYEQALLTLKAAGL